MLYSACKETVKWYLMTIAAIYCFYCLDIIPMPTKYEESIKKFTDKSYPQLVVLYSFTRHFSR